LYFYILILQNICGLTRRTGKSCWLEISWCSCLFVVDC